jgi:autotransporter-associated beta strand protein
LVLSGTNTYGGGTIVTAGTRTVNEPGGNGLLTGSNLSVGTGIAAFTAAAAPVAASPGAISAIPEPGTLVLLAAAIWSAAIYRRFRRRSR